MLLQPLIEKLTNLRLTGMRECLEEQMAQPRYSELTFEERLGLLVDWEWTRRENNRIKRRLQSARLREQAVLEDMDLSPSRGLDKMQIRTLAHGNWILKRHNVIITGPTGSGKTYTGCALGREACQRDFSVRYGRTSRLLHDINLSHADGSYAKLLNAFARFNLLILDDWLRDPLSSAQARDMLEIMDDRYQRSSTMIISQLPVKDWHMSIGDPTLADAILDRVIHNAYRINLKGESRRKLNAMNISKKGEKDI